MRFCCIGSLNVETRVSRLSSQVSLIASINPFKTAREAQMVLSPKIEREMRKAAATASTNDVKAVGQFKQCAKSWRCLNYFVYGV